MYVFGVRLFAETPTTNYRVSTQSKTTVLVVRFGVRQKSKLIIARLKIGVRKAMKLQIFLDACELLKMY